MDDGELIDDSDDESIDEVSETEDNLKVIARMYKRVVDKIGNRNRR